MERGAQAPEVEAHSPEPAVRRSDSLRLLAEGDQSRILEDFAQREAALAPERNYAALGRAFARQGVQSSDRGDSSVLLASLQATATTMTSPSMASQGRNVAQPEAPGVTSADASRNTPGLSRERSGGGRIGGLGEGGSGGMELRSAERSFVGSSAGGRFAQNDGSGSFGAGLDPGSVANAGDAAHRAGAGDTQARSDASTGRMQRASRAYTRAAGVYAPVPMGFVVSATV